MDPYTVLGVSRSASAEVIARAYRTALDGLRTSGEAGRAGDVERLDALRTAWKVLGDPASRADYDAAQGDGLAAVPPAPTSAGRVDGDGPRRLRFEFTGNGGEYFRIWIVNITLSILTLGIYSAWAKVRREQYFHRNLKFDGTGFDYHGDPKAILKGRVIAVVLLVLLSVAEKLGPLAYGIALLAFLPAVPWLLVRALRFRAHNTSYAGLRFRFEGSTADAAKTVLGYGLLALVTLGIALPLFFQRIQRFVLNALRFGTAPFLCEVTAGRYFMAYAMPVLALFAIAVVAGILGAVKAGDVAVVVVAFGVLALMLLARPYLAVTIGNAVWNATTLSGNRFASHMTLRGYVGIVVVNAVLLLLTLGFFWPWAKVRLARYRAECMALDLDCAREDFLAAEGAEVTAAGEEIADMFDIDIGA